jgi:hypothetical protein
LQQLGLGPRILAEAPPDFVLIGRFNDMQRLALVSHRAANQDEPVLNEAVHERGMRVPVLLLADLA